MHDKDPLTFLQNLKGISEETRRMAIMCLPNICTTEEGNVFLSWDIGPEHFEFEVMPDGTAEWFHRNRKTDTAEGGDIAKC